MNDLIVQFFKKQAFKANDATIVGVAQSTHSRAPPVLSPRTAFSRPCAHLQSYLGTLLLQLRGCAAFYSIIHSESVARVQQRGAFHVLLLHPDPRGQACSAEACCAGPLAGALPLWQPSRAAGKRGRPWWWRLKSSGGQRGPWAGQAIQPVRGQAAAVLPLRTGVPVQCCHSQPPAALAGCPA